MSVWFKKKKKSFNSKQRVWILICHMCLHPTYLLSFPCSPQYSTILNLSLESTDLSHHVSAALSLKLLSAPLHFSPKGCYLKASCKACSVQLYTSSFHQPKQKSQNARSHGYENMISGKSQNSEIWWQLLWQWQVHSAWWGSYFLTFFFLFNATYT